MDTIDEGKSNRHVAVTSKLHVTTDPLFKLKRFWKNWELPLLPFFLGLSLSAVFFKRVEFHAYLAKADSTLSYSVPVECKCCWCLKWHSNTTSLSIA